MVSAIASRLAKPIYMENVTQLPVRSRSNLIVKRYPDGSFTTGRSQPPKVDKHYKPLEGIASHTTFYGATKVSIPARQPERDSDPVTLEKIALDFEKAGNQEMANYFGDRYASEILSGRHFVQNSDRLVEIGDDLAVPPLGLSDTTICHNGFAQGKKKAAKRGSKGITTHGKRRVRCACALLEMKYSRKCLSFLTATLPAFADSNELKLICTNWADLIRKFIQELKRMLEGRGFPASMVWVTEIQEDRYQNSGEVAPHLHLVMVGKLHRFAKNWAIAKGEVRSLWERMLSNLLGRPVTCLAATRVECPRKSLQGEFSSYLSKGGKMIEQIVKDGKADQLPSSYWGCSDNLKKAIDARTEILKGKEAEDFIDSLEDMKQAGLLFYKPIIIYAKNLGKEITVGFVGWIKEPEIVTQFLAA
jgi:hypothetical protein